MQIIVNVPDAQATRVLTKFAAFHGYSETIRPPTNGGSVPNPETRAQFCKRKLAEYVKSCVAEQEAREAELAAGTQSRASTAAIDIT
jgi:hypothetical protein